MSAFDEYKQYVAVVNKTDESITELVNVRRGQIRELSRLLADVIIEVGYIGNMEWIFDSIDQSDFVLRCAIESDASKVLYDFLMPKQNTYYDLERSPDNDLATLELVYIRDSNMFFLKMHREFIRSLIEKYHIVVTHESLVRYMSALLENATYFSVLTDMFEVHLPEEKSDGSGS